MKRKQPTRNSVVRSRKISVSMTVSQYQAVADWAKKNRISKSEAIRSVILSDVVCLGDTPEYIDTRHQLYYEIERVANNLKQIIHKTKVYAYWKTFLRFEQYYCDVFDGIRKVVQDDFVFPEPVNTDLSHKVSVLVTDPEYNRINRASGTLTMSDYVKVRLSNYQSRRWTVDVSEAKKVITMVNRIGKVVNHIAYMVNAGAGINESLELHILAVRMDRGNDRLLKAEEMIRNYEAIKAKRQAEQYERQRKLDEQRRLDEMKRLEELRRRQEQRRIDEQRRLEEQKRFQPVFDKLDQKGVIWLIDNRRYFVVTVDRRNFTADVICCEIDVFAYRKMPQLERINIRMVQQCVEAPILYMETKHTYVQGAMVRLEEKTAAWTVRYDVYVLIAYRNNVIVTYSEGRIYIFEDKKDRFILYDDSWKPTDVVFQVL